MGFRPSPTADIEFRTLYQPELYGLSKLLAETANRNAPDGSPGRPQGASTSHKPRVSLEADGPHNYVENTDKQAGHIIEFGSVTTPEYAPMRRAIRQLGLELRDAGSEGASGRERGPSKDTRTIRIGED